MTETVFVVDPYAKRCGAVVVDAAAGRIVLDRTVFYPTGGGQPGDTGQLLLAGGVAIDVLGTIKGENGEVVHEIDALAALPRPGTPVTARIDWARRHRLMRFHTALHLLCAVVGAPVTGGRMGENKAHLDFDIEMSALVAADIEARLAELVAADAPVEPGEITEAALDADPALVKTLSVQPPRGHGTVRTIRIPGVDLQPCGGTHVSHTAEIGALKVVRIRSEGKHNKRVTIAFAAPD